MILPVVPLAIMSSSMDKEHSQPFVQQAVAQMVQFLRACSAVQVSQSRRKYVPVGLVPPSMAAQLCSTCTTLLRAGFYVAGKIALFAKFFAFVSGQNHSAMLHPVIPRAAKRSREIHVAPTIMFRSAQGKIVARQLCIENPPIKTWS